MEMCFSERVFFMKEKAKENLLMTMTGIILFVNTVLIYMYPPHRETAALVGAVLLGIGAALFIIAVFYIKRNRVGKLITGGPYGLVRHPMYLGAMIMFFSHILLGQSWAVILGAMVANICCYLMTFTEEKKNLAKFGDEYRLYMDAVPRMNIFKGISNLLNSKKGI